MVKVANDVLEAEAVAAVEAAAMAAQDENNPPRVVVYGTGDAVELCLHNALGIGGRIELPVLAAFLKCFFGAERILAFGHLLVINHFASLTPESRGVTDEHSFSRNSVILGMLLAGTMYEVGDALNDLSSAKVAVDPAMQLAWEPLNAIRKQWFHEKYAATIRHNFSHHLGERHVYAAGIHRLAKNGEDPLVLYETDGGKRYTGRYHGPWNAQFRAHDIKDDDIGEFLRRTNKAQQEFPNLLYQFFREVLDARGVPVIVDPNPRSK